LASNRAPARPASPPGNAALVGSPLDRRLTFSTFQVGRSNQLAFSAAQRAVGRTTSFCPLYVHSAVGLGKTHLLQAVAHTAASQGRSVIYLTAEKFMYGFVASLQAQTSIAFKERLRTIDLLIFDDAQFLQGKAIQAEFGHALNALLDAGRDVIVAADRPPNDLEAVDERVRSRLGAGLCVEIGPLDEPLRLKILEARVSAARSLQPNFELSPAVLAFDADRSAVDRRGGGGRDPRPHPLARAQAREDRGHSEAGCKPLQRVARRHPLVATDRSRRQAASGRDVSRQDADHAFAP